MKLQYTLRAMLFMACISAFGGAQSQSVGVNDDGSTPSSAAMLDVKSTTKGLLIPRVALTSTTSNAPIGSGVVTSMAVYNTATANDVSPGYYYWDGSAWVRFIGAGPQKINVVAKSATGTLATSDNMVLASGNITLHLPSVTSADNGLEITVKNSGTYTDLVTVDGTSGATIDGQTSSTLTRYVSRTYIASGTNWVVKNKEMRPDNEYEVSARGSFTTIAEVLSFLSSHMTGPSVVKLGGGTYNIAATQTINLSYPLTIEGSSYGQSEIKGVTGVSGNPLFSCTSEVNFKMISFTALNNSSGSNAIHLTGSGKYYEVKDCDFTGFYNGVTMTSNSELWLFEADFIDIANIGMNLADASGNSAGPTMKISEVDFSNCLTGVSLTQGQNAIVSILNCYFYNSTGQTGIVYVPATFTTFNTVVISNSGFNRTGTYMSGFDFTRTDGRDANAYIEGNPGQESKKPHCKVNVLNSANTTTISTANNYVKANWTNSTSYTCKFAISGNQVKYLPSYTSDLYMIITGNLSNSQSPRAVNFGICKNGVSTTRYGESTLRVSSADQSFQFSTCVYLPDVTKNDYFELYVTSSSNNDIITIQDVNWFVDSQ